MARSHAPRPPDDVPSALPFIPRDHSLAALREASAGCRGCHLWERATQTVFGEGSRHGKAILVGEQPGNDEDLEGRPFVGPAGKLLDRALEEAGIRRDQVYVTNVVKHFKWEPRGPRRIHAKPNAMEIAACLPWLQAELDVIKPKALVCLGATAAQALLGKKFRVSAQRGQRVASPLAPFVMATVHPSSILRAPDDEARREQYERFVDDLKKLAQPLR
jgi:uracil-DNA glycosylase family protein